MTDYLKAKSEQSAIDIARLHNIDYTTALSISGSVWQQARAALVKTITRIGKDKWEELSLEEKARVCNEVVGALMDKKRVAAFLNRERSSIL